MKKTRREKTDRKWKEKKRLTKNKEKQNVQNKKQQTSRIMTLLFKHLLQNLYFIHIKGCITFHQSTMIDDVMIVSEV